MKNFFFFNLFFLKFKKNIRLKNYINMFNKIVLGLLPFFISFSVFSQAPNIEWQRCLGGISGGSIQVDTTFVIFQGFDNFSNLKNTNDNGFIIVGQTSSNNFDVSGNHGGSDVWVVKINNIGIVQWQKCYGGSYHEWGSDIQQTSDGGYILCGTTSSSDGDVSGNHGSTDITTDIWIVKLNINGIIQWKKCFGGSFSEEANAIKQTSDGGYIVSGTTNSSDGNVSGYNGGTSDAWVLKLNSFGNIEWQKCYGDINNDSFTSVEILNDGSYYFSGTTDSYQTAGSHGDYDFWVVKTDGFGNVLWQKLYGGSARDYGNSLKITPDQGFVYTGETYSYNGDVLGSNNIDNNDSDVWVFRADNLGNILWQNSLGGTISEVGNDVVFTADGGYLVTGYTNSFNGDVSYNYGYYDSWIIKLNSAGNKIWERCYGGVSGDVSNSIVETADGGFVLAGCTSSNDFNSTISGYHGDGDGWVVKLGPYNGLDVLDINKFNISPNPTSDIIKVHLDNFQNAKQYKITDQFGRIIIESTFDNQENDVDISSFKSGIYFLQLDNDSIYKKIIKN